MTYSKYYRHKFGLDGYLVVMDEVHDVIERPASDMSRFFWTIFSKQFVTKAKTLVYTSATIDFAILGDPDLKAYLFVPEDPMVIDLVKVAPIKELVEAEASVHIVANRTEVTMWNEIRKELYQSSIPIYSKAKDAEGKILVVNPETEKRYDHIIGSPSILSGISFVRPKDINYTDNTETHQFSASGMAQSITRGRLAASRVIKVPAKAFTEASHRPNLDIFRKAADRMRRGMTVLDFETVKYFKEDQLLMNSGYVIGDELVPDEAGLIHYYYHRLKAYHLSSIDALNEYSKSFGVVYEDKFSWVDEQDLTVKQLEEIVWVDTLGYDATEWHTQRFKEFKQRLKMCETFIELRSTLATAEFAYEIQKAEKIKQMIESDDRLTVTSIHGHKDLGEIQLTEAASVMLIVTNSFSRLKAYNKAIHFGIYEKLEELIDVGHKYTLRAFLPVANASHVINQPHTKDKLKEFLTMVGAFTFYNADGDVLKNFTKNVSHISIDRVGIYEPAELVEPKKLLRKKRAPKFA